jgi:hypothetical protein
MCDAYFYDLRDACPALYEVEIVAFWYLPRTPLMQVFSGADLRNALTDIPWQ